MTTKGKPYKDEKDKKVKALIEKTDTLNKEIS